jgi:DNA repair protein RadC
MKDLFLGTDAHEALKSLFCAIYEEEKADLLARKLLMTYGTLSRLLMIDTHTLESDIGREAALYLSHSLSLAIRRTADKLTPSDPITPSILVRHFSALYANAGQETVYLVLLDKEEKLLSIKRASVGAADGSGLLPRQVLELALRAGAAAVILTHNHPGGDLNPSESDIKITSAVSASLKTARIRFLGHYIFARGDFCLIDESKAAEGAKS